jgi:hypothetical protein
MLWVTIRMVKLLLELGEQLLDLAGGDRVQRRGRLVEQQHLRAQRDRARDAQALLLAAGQAQAAVLQLVLDLVPQRRLAQRQLDALGQLRLRERLVVLDAVGRRCPRSTSGMAPASGTPCRPSSAGG